MGVGGGGGAEASCPNVFSHCLHANQVVLPEYYLICLPKMDNKKSIGVAAPPPAPWAVRDHFRLRGGGGAGLFARISYPCSKVEYVRTMHLCRSWEGGGGERFTLLKRLGIGNHRGNFNFNFGATKIRFRVQHYKV